MLAKDKILQEKYNGVYPTCQCGCGEKTRYEPSIKDYCRFIHGHQSRLKDHWGDLKSDKRVSAISNARKQKFASGEYDYIREAILQNRKNPELGKKISQGAKGVPKPKPEGFGIGRVQSEATRKKMSDTAKNKWETGNIGKKKHYTSNLEKIFANILDVLDIKYQQFFYAKDIKAFYDFYIPKYNTIIEVDGDFWHCNPNSKFSQPKYSSQYKNIENDKIKTQWAIDNGYKLLRFWENDIKNNIKHVKKILLENLN